MKRFNSIGRLSFVLAVSCFSFALEAQTNTTKLYDPNANAAADIDAAVIKKFAGYLESIAVNGQ